MVFISLNTGKCPRIAVNKSLILAVAAKELFPHVLCRKCSSLATACLFPGVHRALKLGVGAVLRRKLGTHLKTQKPSLSTSFLRMRG